MALGSMPAPGRRPTTHVEIALERRDFAVAGGMGMPGVWVCAIALKPST